MRDLRSLVTLLILALTSLGVVEVVWDFLDSPVDLVKIEADLTVAEREAVRSVVEDALASSGSDVAEVLRAIEALGWARDVRVRRVWPWGIHVSVARETLAARWGEREYLTTDGEVVEVPQSPEASLPKLSGTLSSGEEAMQIYEMLSEQLANQGLILAALEETVLGEWRLTLANGATVLLGSTNLNGRMGRVLAVYQGALIDRMDRVDRIDARYGSGVAVRWRADTLVAGH